LPVRLHVRHSSQASRSVRTYPTIKLQSGVKAST